MGNAECGGKGSVMAVYEFKVVPAPDQSRRIKGLKRGDDSFSLTISGLMNELGQDGWDYVRAETLPHRRRGWMLRRPVQQRHILVFRRRLRGMTDPAAETAEQPPITSPRRVRKNDVVQFVRAGGRKIRVVEPAVSDAAR